MLASHKQLWAVGLDGPRGMNESVLQTMSGSCVPAQHLPCVKGLRGLKDQVARVSVSQRGHDL